MGPMRDASQRISQLLNRRLSGYLETLTPLFSPRKVLGEYMQSAFSQNVPGADANFSEIEKLYKSIVRDTFNVSSKLGTPLANIKNELEINPWEYLHHLDDDKVNVVRISSPVKWVLSYAGGYTLSDLLIQRSRNENPDASDVKQLVLRHLTLWKLLDLAPDISKLLSDLRYNVSIETTPMSGDLPYIVLTSDVPAFRPQDDLIRTVTKLSGKQVFEELIDIDELGSIEDPLIADLTR
jgi:hypothetical protein